MKLKYTNYKYILYFNLRPDILLNPKEKAMGVQGCRGDVFFEAEKAIKKQEGSTFGQIQTLIQN